ncbi:MAG: M67 family metallopeptidase [Acidobacteriota bacterium]
MNEALAEGLEVPAEVLADLQARGVRGYPREVCGLLIGERRAGPWRVAFATEGANLAAQEIRGERFVLDPAHCLEAMKRAAGRGLEVIGVWHTHPDQPAEPSPLDRENAWDRFVTVIVPTSARGAGRPRAFVLKAGRFVESALEVA